MADYPQLALLIDGQWRPCGSGETIPVLNPATEEVIGSLPVASKADLDEALAAVQRSFLPWAQRTPAARTSIMRAAADLIRQRADSIAAVMTLEQGKDVRDAKREVILSAENIEFLSEEARRVTARIVPSAIPSVRQHAVHKVPVGPVAALTPWNFPANLICRKLGAALATGCTVVLKPAEETPGTAIMLAQCFLDAGLPAGVLNLVFGNPAMISEYLIGSPVIRKVSFTGSIPVGKQLARLCTNTMKRYTAELGGHSPVLVFADAAGDATVQACVTAKYRNSGQVCNSPTRFLIEESAYLSFCDRFARTASKLKIGNGNSGDIDMGPVTHGRRLAHMDRLVQDAIQRGARLLTGGRRIGNRGYFFEPTVLADVPLDAAVMQEEPFGPIALLLPFRDTEEAISLANGSPYGLAAYAFTGDADKADILGRVLEAGMIGINHFAVVAADLPFGGLKESGWGVEQASEGILPYLETKLVSVSKLQ
jgi:succinate-semialdehyde dehydrogenase/glutarate-semialdehyde dehydrogenase